MKEAKLQAKADARAARESDQVVKQLQAQARKIEIKKRKVEKKRVAERKKEGLRKLTAILSGATDDRRIRSIRVLEFRYITDRMAPAQHSELREQEQLANESLSGKL
ncbi:hypothetical protein VC83_02371 [Pseudogymnoascus destructans]|uniref:Uncharacterized protein n=1 Tax=Pseudogymnoascus destructans TaxID=655981 RepID=A0A177AGA5_9PEZI|nr:uncharacterized protein VC83_02371 [Pseudogymnoascus destructans]OAF61138.1 hypothetical protein VC83_02371 [Pseudogymnoascus destructans]